MATRQYLRTSKTQPGARSLGITYRDMINAIGTSSVTMSAGPLVQSNGERRFYFSSPQPDLETPVTFIGQRFDAGFTLSGAVSFSFQAVDCNVASMYKLRARVFKITAGGSDIMSEIGVVESATLTASPQTVAINFTPATAIAIAKNERLVLRVSMIPADGSQTFGSDVVVTMTVNNFTAGYMEITETVTMRDNGSKLYLRSTAVNAIGTFLDMLETRASGLAGAAPVQARWAATTAGGTSIQLKQQASPSVNYLNGAGIASSSDATTYVSPTFTPVANCLYLVAVLHADAATEATVPTISTTTGLTFVQVGSSVPFDTIAANAKRLTLFRGLKTSGLSAGTYTVTFGDASTGCISLVYELSPVVTTGANGADAVRNIVTGSANAAANPSITYGAYAAVWNSLVAAFGWDVALTPTPPSGWAAQTNGITTPVATLTLQNRLNTGVTVATTTATAGDWGGIAAEIVAVTNTTGLEWISPRILDGFVATDATFFTGQIYALETDALANATIRQEILRRKPDGTETLVYSVTPAGELTTTLAIVVGSGGTLETANVQFTEDDRIVYRAYAVNVGTMAAGYGVALHHDRTDIGNGDSYIIVYDGPDFKAEGDPAAGPSPSKLMMGGVGS